MSSLNAIITWPWLLTTQQGKHQSASCLFVSVLHKDKSHVLFLCEQKQIVAYLILTWNRRWHSVIMCARPWVAARFSLRSFWSGWPVVYFLWIDLEEHKLLLNIQNCTTGDIYGVINGRNYVQIPNIQMIFMQIIANITTRTENQSGSTTNSLYRGGYTIWSAEPCCYLPHYFLWRKK